MLHPALARALASAHIDDLHRAAARWHTIRLAHGAAHEPRVAATPTQAALWPCQSVVDGPSGPRAGIDLASRWS
jgi:hypothetical protein